MKEGHIVSIQSEKEVILKALISLEFMAETVLPWNFMYFRVLV